MQKADSRPPDRRFRSRDVPDTDRTMRATPFSGGPLHKIQGLVGVLERKRPGVLRRVIGAIAICWLPLALLSCFGDAASTFWTDFGTHVRYLVVVPLLIVADSICIPRLNALACNFLNAGVVTASDRAAFMDVLSSTKRLNGHVRVEMVVILIAYSGVAAIYAGGPIEAAPAWIMDADSRHLTAAGWWGVTASLPMLLALLLAWLWRLGLWVRFLWLTSRLNLRLISVHPDGAGGIGFVGYSSQAFSILALASGFLVAGAVANGIYAGKALTSYHYLILFFVVGVVVVINLPLSIFIGKMLQAWQLGTLEYGALADRFGVEFEKKWLQTKRPDDESMLEREDFSAATDLYQVIDRAYAMRLLPIHAKSVMMLAAAAFIPFLPVALMALPFNVIVDKVAGLLL